MSSKVYIDIDTSILLHSMDNTFHTLFYIIQQMNTESNVWIATSENKRELTLSVNITASTLDKHISSLKQRGILIRVRRETYMLNKETLNIDY